MEDEVVDVQGWKGQGTNELSDEGEHIILRCWKKAKATGENYYTEHKVEKKAVYVLLGIIQRNCTPRESYGPYYLWRKIIELYGLDKKEGMDAELMMSVFNGGKLRARYYFPLYYWPMLILSEWGKIYYGEKNWMYLGE